MASSSLIRDALASAQQELAKKRSHTSHSTHQHSAASSSSSPHTANKRPKTSHPPNRPASSAASTAQSIKDAVAASRSELDAKRKHSHSSSSSHPPTKPLSPYERFITAHWEDDEYDGLSDEERRSALNRRFEAVSFSKKEAWTSEWQRDMEHWSTAMTAWEDMQGRADSATSHTTSASGRQGSSTHKPATTARTSKPASSYSSASPPPSQSSTAVDFSSSPLVAQHYSQQGGQLSLLPYINKHNKAFLTLTFPITRITALVSLLPQPAVPPAQKLFPQLTVATISRAIDYFVQHVSALVLTSAVASGSRVLRPEDYRAVILRRAELWWLRWAQEEDRDVRGRYRTGQLAALEKKRRDAEDRARGRTVKDDDGGGQEEEGEGEEEGADHYGSEDEEEERHQREGGSRMEEEDDDSGSQVSAVQHNSHTTSTADVNKSGQLHVALTSHAAEMDDRASDASANDD